MSETSTSSGGAYYRTAIEMRRGAGTAYAHAEREAAGPVTLPGSVPVEVAQVAALYELAGALYCVAQAIEDS